MVVRRSVVVAIAITAFSVFSMSGQSAKAWQAASPFIAIENELAPRLVIDQPLPGPLARGVVQIQYRVDNVRILPVFGASALSVTPRIGHLHITVDDLPWHWADAGGVNTITIVGLPPGKHKVLIELAGADHQVFAGQASTVVFLVPESSTHVR